MRYLSFSLLFTASLSLSLFGMGDEHRDHPSVSTNGMQMIKASGTVKSISDNHESVRIFHDPIPALKWPAMNMPFDVVDHELTHPFEVGDHVNFEFIQKEGKNIIVRMEKK
ncbi:MAG TPA: copper-binding protein [Sulfuricurvum sp.]|nr:copper-binding protein [Sulfuricurvum sp.]